jgi:two-component system, response regulator / RNA-binding antiterminator
VTAARSTQSQIALILHRAHPTVDAIVRQLTQIGMTADQHWPELPPGLEPRQHAVLFFDADMGHDEQFPWPAGAAPMPTIALIGSEAPGRIAWAIKRGADAHLLKPVAGGGIYSAVLIARDAFARRQGLQQELSATKTRLEKREVLAEATAFLMVSEGLTARQAFHELRLRAMAQRLSIEAMAERIVERTQRRHGRA